jgi:hypothetical protein
MENNPLLDRVGYNNVCVAWDTPPGVYAAAPVLCAQAFFSVCYAMLDTQRAELEADANVIAPFARSVTLVANYVFAFFMGTLPLLLVVSPDRSALGHYLIL